MFNLRKVMFCIACLFTICGVNAEELLRTTKTWEGGDIIYPKGTPEVTSVKLIIEEDVITAFHCHPIPTLGYILKGDVEVETKSGKKIILREGESAVEVLRTLHRGKAIGGPVEIIVFYAGSTSIPNTVLPDNDEYDKYCNR
jgi:quercetin dioxygenase-like cupin family protein